MPLPEIHLVGGTSTEAARLAPVATAMREQARVEPILLAAGPEPLTFAQTLGLFDLTAGLAVPAGADNAETICRLDQLWSTRTPAAVVVQGDAGASLPAAVAAYWRRIPVIHLDAGRRSGDLGATGLTEPNRRLLTQVSTLHLAAAPLAAMNLLDERVPGGDVLLTGNTGLDAALAIRDRLPPYADPALATLRHAGSTAPHRLLVVGLEHTDGVLLQLVRATVRRLTARYPDLDVVMLGTEPSGRSRRVVGAGPLAYADRARLLAEAYLVLTDDGDLQEEALTFGVPALIRHEMSDRMEPLYAGCARVVGPEPETMLNAVAELLDSRVRRDSMTATGNPYGDGRAAKRAAQATAALLGHGPFPEPMPARPTAGVSR
ncbi:MAG TPA: UDP-N-acetylglucosamine 2-epimerase [Actinoplanes sp.]|jgi:UDP-N-acetylglucosamine 2-epimerase (non-hydrolysing)